MGAEEQGRPSELAITLACLPGRYGNTDDWRCADEVRGRLALLGFNVKTQQVAAWLGRMSRVDMPWVERREAPLSRESNGVSSGARPTAIAGARPWAR